MKHPTSLSALLLSNIFLEQHKRMPNNEVDMECPFWNVCGTIACHAGHFASALGIQQYTKNYLIYEDSADLMAQFLGFNDGRYLREWASNNPKVWGNRYGYVMFNEWSAFDPKYSKLKTLETIGKHWLEVAKRLHKVGL